MTFANRAEAGRRLAAELLPLAGPEAVVVGLPRGGVPVAFEVAQALGAALDVIVVRKLGVPSQPELAMGAVGEGDARVIDADVLRRSGVSARRLAKVEARERAELDRRTRRFRQGGARVPLAGRTVIIVDDGIATGSTARAACLVARKQGAARVVLATPVGYRGVEDRLRPDADEVICLTKPDDFAAVGQFYLDFTPTTDEEVIELLHRAGEPPTVRSGDVSVPTGTARLDGHLDVPEGASGIVVFAHGSGSSRHSPRNRCVAEQLGAAGFATLLLDVLTTDEEADRDNVFDIELLGHRLLEVAAWIRTQRGIAHLPLGYFGASTGAAAALWAAADPAADVIAVVSCGGRPDLAGPRLALVRAPTLLIVGGVDDVGFDVNRQAQARLVCENRLEIVPGASHLFEEPGTLERAARIATDWYDAHLSPHRDLAAGS